MDSEAESTKRGSSWEMRAEQLLPFHFNVASDHQVVDDSLMEEIDKPPQVRHAVGPLLFTIYERDVQNVGRAGPLLELPELSPDQGALVDGVAHLATALCLAPVFFDLPNRFGRLERGDGAVYIARRDVKVVALQPYAASRGGHIHSQPPRLTMLACDVGHGRDQGLGRLVVVLAPCAG